MAIFNSDVYSNRPLPGNSGNLFIASDAFQLYRDDGLTWKPWWAGYPFKVPPRTGWSWVNQGTASIDQTRDVFHLITPIEGAHNLRIQIRNMPTPTWSLTSFIRSREIIGISSTADGLILRDSNSGRLILFGRWENDLKVVRFNSPTSWNSFSFSLTLYNLSYNFLRITDDNTNFTFWWSGEGQNWIQLYQENRTNWLASPDGIGYGAQDGGSTKGTILSLYSWEES